MSSVAPTLVKVIFSLLLGSLYTVPLPLVCHLASLQLLLAFSRLMLLEQTLALLLRSPGGSK